MTWKRSAQALISSLAVLGALAIASGADSWLSLFGLDGWLDSWL